MSRNNAPAVGTFEHEFRRRLDNIMGRAKAAGLTISDLCKATGTARATPDRWRRRAPKTIEIIDKLEAEVAKAEARQA